MNRKEDGEESNYQAVLKESMKAVKARYCKELERGELMSWRHMTMAMYENVRGLVEFGRSSVEPRHLRRHALF
jgi:hypothetical protein